LIGKTNTHRRLRGNLEGRRFRLGLEQSIKFLQADKR
jgi:hypothetical protein